MMYSNLEYMLREEYVRTCSQEYLVEDIKRCSDGKSKFETGSEKWERLDDRTWIAMRELSNRGEQSTPQTWSYSLLGHSINTNFGIGE